VGDKEAMPHLAPIFCSHIPVLKSSVKMAKDCVKLIYVLSCVVLANLLVLIALSAISAALQVNGFTDRSRSSKISMRF